jgi:hypothetical protein
VCKERGNECSKNQQKNVFGLAVDSTFEIRLLQARGIEVEIVKKSNKKWNHPELG